MQQNSGSFRDPSGFVFEHEGKIFRSINECYEEDWQHISSCGLLGKAVAAGQMIEFSEVPLKTCLLPEQTRGMEQCPARMLQVARVPFISYPYEWSFSQLKDAALLTLDLQCLALEHGCILKDASAFNVQFVNGKPVFIDILSFEQWKNSAPWQAYGQFCSQFLAPLALIAKRDIRLGTLSRQWVGGIPLDFASRLLPWKTRLSPGLLMHLHLHASMQMRHADGRKSGDKVRKAVMTKQRMLDVADSLRSAVKKLSLPRQTTEWGDYYTDTNYTEVAAQAKSRLVSSFATRFTGEAALDLGANTGQFSNLLAPHFAVVISADIDPLAVERHYTSNPAPGILPLIFDAANPTPAIGWDNAERRCFTDRCTMDLVLALALCHHLVITAGIPLRLVALYFSALLKDSGSAVVEFIPKEDSQVQRLLSARDDIFSEYSEEHFVQAFMEAGFTVSERHSLPETLRILFVFQKRPK